MFERRDNCIKREREQGKLAGDRVMSVTVIPPRSTAILGAEPGGLSRVWGDVPGSDMISSVSCFWPGDQHGVGFALGRNRTRQRGAQC